MLKNTEESNANDSDATCIPPCCWTVFATAALGSSSAKLKDFSSNLSEKSRLTVVLLLHTHPESHTLVLPSRILLELLGELGELRFEKIESSVGVEVVVDVALARKKEG